MVYSFFLILYRKASGIYFFNQLIFKTHLYCFVCKACHVQILDKICVVYEWICHTFFYESYLYYIFIMFAPSLYKLKKNPATERNKGFILFHNILFEISCQRLSCSTDVYCAKHRSTKRNSKSPSSYLLPFMIEMRNLGLE